MPGLRRAADGIRPSAVVDLTREYLVPGVIDLTIDHSVLEDLALALASRTFALTNDDAVVEAYTCPICIELPNRPVATKCGHIFCFECFCRYRSVAVVCPLCQKEVNEVIKLYI